MQINCIKLVFIVDDGGKEKTKGKKKKWEYVQFRGRLTTGLALKLQKQSEWTLSLLLVVAIATFRQWLPLSKAG